MTFQERWAEGPPDEPRNLLTPNEIQDWLALGGAISPKHLCQDYLTLWGELDHERQISDDAIQELTLERDRNLDLTVKVDGLRKALEKFNTVLVDAYLGNTDD